MALTGFPVALRQAWASSFKAQAETGGTPSYDLYTGGAGGTLIATLAAPLLAPVAGGISIDNSTTPQVTLAGVGGNLDAFILRAGDGSEVCRGTVSTTTNGTGDIQIVATLTASGYIIQYLPTAVPTITMPA